MSARDTIARPDYDSIYREMHPRQLPQSPWEQQRELRHLWPAYQEKFKRQIDAAIRSLAEQEGR